MHLLIDLDLEPEHDEAEDDENKRDVEGEGLERGDVGRGHVGCRGLPRHASRAGNGTDRTVGHRAADLVEHGTHRQGDRLVAPAVLQLAVLDGVGQRQNRGHLDELRRHIEEDQGDDDDRQVAGEQGEHRVADDHGDHAAGEQHRDDDHIDKAVAALEVGAGQRVGDRAGDEHIDQRADHGDDHRIFQSAEHIALLEDVLVGVQRYILRDQEEGTLGQLALGRKGAGHHIDEGQHTGQRHQRNDDIQKNLYSLIAGGAGLQRAGGAHLVFLMGKGHCHCSTAPFFSTGRTRRTAWRSCWR